MMDHPQAPRPLPLHLAMQNLTYLSSLVALPHLNDGSISWSPALKKRAGDLVNELNGIDPDVFRQAVEQEIEHRITAFATGVERFKSMTRNDDLPPLPVVWAAGTTSVKHAAAAGPPIILVPSLINRARILDLQSRRSLTRYLAGMGLNVYLVDWDAPGDIEKHFTLDDYVDRLSEIVKFVGEETAKPPCLVGYCMGGLLTLALAHRASSPLGGLALLATPWDFHAVQASATMALRASLPILEATIDAMGDLPVDVLQAMFTSLDPCGTIRKYRAFAAAAGDSDAAKGFVVLEDWLNDGVPLSGPVAKECLRDWYCDNVTLAGTWRNGGMAVDPGSVGLPTLLVIPSNDTIVPPASALALAERMPNAKVHVADAGHIGMVAGSKAERELYEPLSAFLLQCSKNR